MEGVWAELQDLESTLDSLHEVKQGSADMLKCRVALTVASMKEALQEQQSYGLQLKSVLDAARFSAERRAGRYAQELKMIKQQHFLSTYPFQLEKQLENILHKAHAMSAWHAATAESRNKLDVRKLKRNVSMKRSCVNIWSRAAFHASRRTHALQKIQRLSTFSKLAHSFWCLKRTIHLQNIWFNVVAKSIKSLTPLLHVCFVGRAHIAHRHWLTAMLEHACERKPADAREKKRSSDAPEEQEPRCCSCDECDYAEEEPFRQSKRAQRERKSWLSAASANTLQLKSESLLLKLRVHAALKSKAEPRSARIAKTLQPNTHTHCRHFDCEKIGGEESAESRDPPAEIAKKTYKCDYSCGFQVLCQNMNFVLVLPMCADARTHERARARTHNRYMKPEKWLD
jgi:hypothetical protein